MKIARSVLRVALWQLLLGVFSVPARAATTALGLDDIQGLNARQTNAVASLLSSGGPSSFSAGRIVGGLVFGAVGFVAFVYGQKNRQWQPLAIGAALIGLPYVISGTLWMFIVGIGLCFLLYFLKEL